MAALARQSALTAALGAALGVRDQPEFLNLSMQTALPILLHASTDPTTAPAFWRARDTAANLRALAAAYAGAYSALEAGGGAAEDFEDMTMLALAAALAACPDSHRPGLRAALIEQDGFASAVSAGIARAAAAVPEPGAALQGPSMRGTASLVMAAALGSDLPLEFKRDNARREVAFKPMLHVEPGERAAMAELLAAAPSLLECVADTIIACAPWYAAVTAAVGPSSGGTAAGGRSAGRALRRPNAAGRAGLVDSFCSLRVSLLDWTVTLLLLVPRHALAAASAGRGGPIVRLAPALLAMAEAALALAGALPSAELVAVLTETARAWLVSLVDGALCAFEQAVSALDWRAPTSPVDDASALVGDDGGALAALVRMSALEPPLIAAAGGRTPGANARTIFTAHSRARYWATKALVVLCTTSAGPRIAALLLAEPALFAAVGAAVGPTQSERDFGLTAGGGRALIARRRMPAASVLLLLASGPASIARGGATWMSGLLA